MKRSSPSQPKDSELIRRAKKGDQEALVSLYERYRPSVFSYIYYRVSDQESAEDLTADVFLRMLTKLDTYVHKTRPVLAWLYTIARNLVIDHYRNNGKVHAVSLDEAVIASEHGHPGKVVQERLDQECLKRALEQLTEEQRQVILLKFIDGRENSEVAEILGKNERAIRSLQHRALVTLQKVMEQEHCYEP